MDIAEHREPIADERILFLAHDAVVGRRIFSSAANALGAMRDWLIEHIDRPGNTHCALLKEVCAAPAPSPTYGALRPEAQAIASSAEVLCRAVREVLKDCICNALISSCPSCNDTRVLLACLTVEDCVVTDICNLERQFVIAGPNLRYWIPQLHQFGEALERWCCEPCCDECADEDELKDVGESQSVQRELFGSMPREVELALSSIFDACQPSRQGVKKMQRHAPLFEAFTKVGERPTPSDADTVAHLVEQVKAEFEGKILALREEIEFLRAAQTGRRGPKGKGVGA